VRGVVFIESNTSGTGAQLVRKALNRGLCVHFVTADPSRYPFLTTEMLHPLLVDTQDLRAVERLVHELPAVAAVLSSSDYYVESAAAVARSLGLFAADPEAVHRCRDKWALSRALTSAGVSTPATVRVTDHATATEALREVGLPLVVKPVSGSGSIDVRLHRDARSYFEHVEVLLAGTDDVVLAQRFVEGSEYSVEVLGTDAGMEVFGVTKKHLGPEPTFLEVGHDFPAPLSAQDERVLLDESHRALRAVGLSRGPAHVELRLGEDGPVVIEVNPRLAGGMIPSLIQHALGVDVLERLLDVHLGEDSQRVARVRRAASIAQIVPPEPGIVAQVQFPPLTGLENIVGAWTTKGPGHVHRGTGDFRDRIGHVISRGSDTVQSRAALNAYLPGVRVVMRSTESLPALLEDTGRVGRSLFEEAEEIVRRQKPEGARRKVFEALARIDQAHVLMLAEQGCLALDTARAILSHVNELEQDGFTTLLAEAEPRGPYLLYESSAIRRLGVEVGGAGHLGRSRNDINATMFRLRLREEVRAFSATLWRLRSALLQSAERSTDVLMPLYSQYQPGTPSTLGAYWLGVEEALSRDQRSLETLLGSLNESPLGVCAGGGTSIPINPERTARLLGFSTTCRSAIDGVASRDLAVRFVATAAICGMNISRIAQDLQLWSTREFDFIELPDGLVGGSSNMPQKRNPYLLEVIKGRAIAPSGRLTTMLSGMSGVPFGNSVEVGTEALSGLTDALTQVRDAASLCALVVQGTSARPESMVRACEDGLVEAIAVVETLVREQGVSFRAAHHEVGAAIRANLAAGDDARLALRNLLPKSHRDFQLRDWVRSFDYGGGPGAVTTSRNLASARERLRRDADQVRAMVADWADAEGLRRAQVQELIDG